MTKSDVYDQHDKAFSLVSAYVIAKRVTNERANAKHTFSESEQEDQVERVATIAFKFPKDGAGRLNCFVHWIGAEMSKGYAGGYGYDKRSAAVQDAVEKIKPYKVDDPLTGEYWEKHVIEVNAEIDAFKALFKNIGGKDWSDVLRDAGYKVWSAI
jgi:hypothetical protein